MRFDSSRAWQEAMAAVNANREVLFAVAGVFFLLPGLASALFLSDVQESMLANLGNPAGAELAMQGQYGTIIGFGLVSFFLQSIGYMAMLALLTDRARPTVGQAIASGIRSMPTVIGAALVFFVGYLLVLLVFGSFVGILGATTGLKLLAGALVLLLAAAMVYAMVKLSLLLPVIAIEKVTNPVAALARSWRLTKGNSFRLFGFYLLLFIVYIIVVMLFGGVTMAIATLAAGKGMVTKLVSGLVSGIFGALASMVLTSVLAAVHRQLAGPSADVLSTTFD